MKTYNFIEANIGALCYLTGAGDLAMDSEYRKYIFNKLPLRLLRLNKKGLAIVQDESVLPKIKEFSIKPSNLRLYKELVDLPELKED